MIKSTVALAATAVATDAAEKTTSPTRQKCPPLEGKIFGTQADDRIVKEVPKWPSLGHYILDRLANHTADKLIIVDYKSSRHWTGKELHDKILNVASALVDVYQFKPDTPVCIHYVNSDISTILALGVILAGGIVVCSYPKDPYQELLYLARKVEPKFLFCDQSQVHLAARLETDMGYPVFGIALGYKASEEHLQFQHFEHLLNYDHKQSRSIRHLPVACLDTQTQAAFILMSSGTTGKPKAVPATHSACLVDMLRFEFSNSKFPSITFATPASLDYVSGRMLQLSAIQVGYKIVLMDIFEPDTFLDAVQRFKVNVIYLGAASFYNLITYKNLDKYDISSLRIIFPMGAKVVYLQQLAEFLEKHPHIIQVKQGYGTSEFCGAAHKSFTPKEYLNNSENCGHLPLGVQIKVVHPVTGKLLGCNQQGILYTKSMSLFPGYYDVQEMRRRQQERSKNKGTKVVDDLIIDSPYICDDSVFDSEGFYITGDLGYFTDKEELIFVGRQKELMSCRGQKKVLPQELEEVISESNFVSRVCVFGVPKRNEPLISCPRAFVVPKDEYYSMNLTECKKALEYTGTESVICNNNNSELINEEKLEHRGTHKLCRLEPQIQHLLAEALMSFVNERVGWEKQLTGGIVILDDIPILRATGKMNKSYLRNLTEEEISIYGDTSFNKN